MRVVIVSGGRGEGKTTFVRERVEHLVQVGKSVGGVLSPAVVGENGARIGYDLIMLPGGHRRELVRSGDGPTDAQRVGRWWFSDTALAAGNEAIVDAVRDRSDVVVVDEIGPLEFEGRGWSPGLEVALSGGGRGQTLVLIVRPSLVPRLTERYATIPHDASMVNPPWPETLAL